jgi:hypothetical protein
MPGPPGEKVGVGRMQQIPEVVVQPAQDRHRYESAHHRNETADLAAARLGEHPHEENSQKRAIRCTQRYRAQLESPSNAAPPYPFMPSPTRELPRAPRTDVI